MDGDIVEERPPEQPGRRRRVLTPRRITVVISLVLFALRLIPQFRYARNIYRYRRQLRFALTVLLLLRRLRKS